MFSVQSMFPLQPMFPSPPGAEMMGRVDFLLRRAKQELCPRAGPVPLKQPRYHERVFSLKGCITAFLLHGLLGRHALEPSYPPQSEATTKKT